MKKEKNRKYVTEEQAEIKRFIFVLVGLIIIIVGIYFFTRAFITKDLFNKTSDVKYTEGQINYDVAIVGNMLNRPLTEYYIMAFAGTSTQVNYYNTVVSKYLNEENALKVYYIDLDNALNKDYVAKDEKASTTFKSIDELKFGEITLLKVKNGKVTKFITNVDDIKNELNIE